MRVRLLASRNLTQRNYLVSRSRLLRNASKANAASMSPNSPNSAASMAVLLQLSSQKWIRDRGGALSPTWDSGIVKQSLPHYAAESCSADYHVSSLRSTSEIAEGRATAVFLFVRRVYRYLGERGVRPKSTAVRGRTNLWILPALQSRPGCPNAKLVSLRYLHARSGLNRSEPCG